MFLLEMSQAVFFQLKSTCWWRSFLDSIFKIGIARIARSQISKSQLKFEIDDNPRFQLLGKYLQSKQCVYVSNTTFPIEFHYGEISNIRIVNVSCGSQYS